MIRAEMAVEEDYWDKESAIFLYCYLTKLLKIPAEIAKEAAEWIANKDADEHWNEENEGKEYE